MCCAKTTTTLTFPVKYSFACFVCLFRYLFSYISLRCFLPVYRIYLIPIYISLSKIACLCFLAAFVEKKCQKAVYSISSVCDWKSTLVRKKNIYHHRYTQSMSFSRLFQYRNVISWINLRALSYLTQNCWTTFVRTAVLLLLTDSSEPEPFLPWDRPRLYSMLFVSVPWRHDDSLWSDGVRSKIPFNRFTND